MVHAIRVNDAKHWSTKCRLRRTNEQSEVVVNYTSVLVYACKPGNVLFVTHRLYVAYVAVNECMQVFVINYHKQELTVSVDFIRRYSTRCFNELPIATFSFRWRHLLTMHSVVTRLVYSASSHSVYANFMHGCQPPSVRLFPTQTRQYF